MMADETAADAEANTAQRSIYDVFSTEATREKSGTWLDYGKAGRFLIARAGGANKRFTQVMIAKMKPYRRVLQAKQNNPDAQALDLLRSIQEEVYAETIVLGWEGVKDVLGEEIPYSKEAARKLFKDLPALFDEIAQFANDLSNFQAEDTEEDAKN